MCPIAVRLLFLPHQLQLSDNRNCMVKLPSYTLSQPCAHCQTVAGVQADNCSEIDKAASAGVSLAQRRHEVCGCAVRACTNVAVHACVYTIVNARLLLGLTVPNAVM